MVVPPASGVTLLKEHAWYEYGASEFQSVIDFDYHFADNEFVTKYDFFPYTLFHNTISSSLTVFVIIGFVYLLGHFITSLLKQTLLNKRHDSKFSINRAFKIGSGYPQEVEYDLEAAPSLSYSNSSTPSNSPSLVKDSFRVQTFTFEDRFLPNKSN